MGLSFPLEATEDHKRLIKLAEEAGTSSCNGKINMAAGLTCDHELD